MTIELIVPTEMLLKVKREIDRYRELGLTRDQTLEIFRRKTRRRRG